MPAEVRRSPPYRRVLIVDDAPDVRQDLRLLLQLSGELEIVGEAANGQEAIRQSEAFGRRWSSWIWRCRSWMDSQRRGRSNRAYPPAG